MIRTVLYVLTFTFVILAFAGLVHHYAFTGLWFQWGDFWHHETLIALNVCSLLWVVGLLIWGRGNEPTDGK